MKCSAVNNVTWTHFWLEIQVMFAAIVLHILILSQSNFGISNISTDKVFMSKSSIFTIFFNHHG